MPRRTGRPQAASLHSLEREQLLLRAVDEVEVSLACFATPLVPNEACAVPSNAALRPEPRKKRTSLHGASVTCNQVQLNSTDSVISSPQQIAALAAHTSGATAVPQCYGALPHHLLTADVPAAPKGRIDRRACGEWATAMLCTVEPSRRCLTSVWLCRTWWTSCWPSGTACRLQSSPHTWESGWKSCFWRLACLKR